MKKYVAYYRVSKDSFEAGRSKSRGLGLEAQTQIVRHYYGDSIVMEFTETKSAKNITDRPVLQEAMQYCIDNGCWLVVAKLDRLSRNTVDVLTIIKNLDKMVSFCDIPSDGEADEFIITIFAAIAKRERDLISIRTKQALKVRIERSGPWQTGNPEMKNGNMQKLAAAARILKAETNENNIRALQLILSYKAQRKSLGFISNALNTNKFVTSTGCEFTPTAVSRIYNREMAKKQRTAA